MLGAAPPILQLGAFSGRTISQGLLLAEALATVLFGAWLSRHHVRVARADFEKPLFAFVAVCLASLAAIVVLPDHRVENSASTAVSVGQILLVLWPVGVYLAAAEFIADTTQLRWLQRAMVTLAISQLAAPFAPLPWRPYMAGSGRSRPSRRRLRWPRCSRPRRCRRARSTC